MTETDPPQNQAPEPKAKVVGVPFTPEELQRLSEAAEIRKVTINKLMKLAALQAAKHIINANRQGAKTYLEDRAKALLARISGKSLAGLRATPLDSNTPEAEDMICHQAAEEKKQATLLLDFAADLEELFGTAGPEFLAILVAELERRAETGTPNFIK